MRSHIREQIDYRISVMDRECYNSGSCKICGCKTTNLQMANKACEGKCYPAMMKAKEWCKVRELYYYKRDSKNMEQNVNWINSVKELGELTEKTTIKTVFHYKGSCLPTKLNINASCGCTSTLWNPNSKELKVTLKTGTVPKHLKNRYSISKSIRLDYLCDGVSHHDILKINAVIVKK